MDIKIARDIIDSMSDADRHISITAALDKSRYIVHPISEKDVISLKTLDGKGMNLEGGILFVDGGNAEIFSSPSLTLQLIRVYAAHYLNNQRVWGSRTEFYVMASVCEKDANLCFDVKFYPAFSGKSLLLENAGLQFDYHDNRLSQDGMPSVRKVVDGIRRIAELMWANECLQHLNGAGAVVLDGILECAFPQENVIMDKLSAECSKKGIYLCALAKTSRLLTGEGHALVDQLFQFMGNDKFRENVTAIYAKIASSLSASHPSDIYFTKLHRLSEYIFRLELHKQHSNYVEPVLNCLAANSRDMTFPGYPFGLIDADRFARIANYEAEYHRTIFSARAGKKWKNLSSGIRAVNAHSVLDSI